MYFDFENDWKSKIREGLELEESQFENELTVLSPNNNPLSGS